MRKFARVQQTYSPNFQCLTGKLERGDMVRFETEMKHTGEALRADDWEAFKAFTIHLEGGMVATKALFMKKTEM